MHWVVLMADQRVVRRVDSKAVYLVVQTVEEKVDLLAAMTAVVSAAALVVQKEHRWAAQMVAHSVVQMVAQRVVSSVDHSAENSVEKMAAGKAAEWAALKAATTAD